MHDLWYHMSSIAAKYTNLHKLLIDIPIPHCGYKGFRFRGESRSFLVENWEIESTEEALTNVRKPLHIIGVP